MRKPTAAQADLLSRMGDIADILRCDPMMRRPWWLEGARTVRAQVADSALAARWIERTGQRGPIGFYTRTEAGRAALAKSQERGR